MNNQNKHEVSSSVRIVDGLAALAPRYRVLFCDVWGVVHDGVRAFAPAVDALRRFRAGGGIVILVSNAPRPGTSVLPQLEAFGAERDAFDTIVTSGDISRAEIERRAGQKLHHIGPPRDLPLFDGASGSFVPVEQADYVVCTGLADDDHETVETYRATLETMRRRQLWMLCANPDLIVERGNVLVPCAGSLAAAYEAIGGEVLWAGKPHAPIYDRALAQAGSIAGKPLDKSDILAIGDAIRTDVAGAANFGIDALLVARGIHAAALGAENGCELSPGRVQSWLAQQNVKPQAVIRSLTW